MTDLEMTKHCAEALGLGYIRPCEENPRAVEYNDDPEESAWMLYCPLDEDGEAMALVKRFQVQVNPQANGRCSSVIFLDGDDEIRVDDSADVNRAIVEVVATMQARRIQSPQREPLP